MLVVGAASRPIPVVCDQCWTARLLYLHAVPGYALRGIMPGELRLPRWWWVVTGKRPMLPPP